MNIYLDIDGVLLANELNASLHANDFLRKVLTEYPDTTYWLTTHCQGDPTVPIQHIGHLFEEDVQDLMKLIKPTTWDLAKTRAIDFTQPFLWFDDDLYPEDEQTLLRHNAIDNWVEVNLMDDPAQLQNFLVSFPIPLHPGTQDYDK
jgi:hypothetical protein